MAIIFDTETTGLITSVSAPPNTQPKIIELFALKVDDVTLEIVDELELLIDPKEELEKIIIDVTGLTNNDLNGKGEFSVHFKSISDFWVGQRTACGHNVTFDCDMLEVETIRLGMRTRFPWTPNRVCTVEATEHYEGRRLSLTDLHTYLFGEGFPKAHRARNDVMATYRCIKELVRRGDIVFE